MADIQHVDIPDGQRHELKGASTALVGQVPVSDGVGGTAFKKITAENLESVTGDGPLSVVDGVISTGKNAFATVRKTSNNLSILVGQNQGVFAQSGGMRVQRAGVYHISSSDGASVITNSVVNFPTDGQFTVTSTSSQIYPVFRNRTTGVQQFIGMSGIVAMNTTDIYDFTSNTMWTVVQVA